MYDILPIFEYKNPGLGRDHTLRERASRSSLTLGEWKEIIPHFFVRVLLWFFYFFLWSHGGW